MVPPNEFYYREKPDEDCLVENKKNQHRIFSDAIRHHDRVLIKTLSPEGPGPHECAP
jgi:hypothetical protein